MIAYTNVVFQEMGDTPNEIPEVRPIIVMGYDGKYAQIKAGLLSYEINRDDVHLSYALARSSVPSTLEPAMVIDYGD